VIKAVLLVMLLAREKDPTNSSYKNMKLHKMIILPVVQY
jgi:hypothetical protein